LHFEILIDDEFINPLTPITIWYYDLL
jgi:hypothetical protein